MSSWLRSVATTILGVVVVLVSLLVRTSSTEAFLTLLGIGVGLTSLGGSLLGAKKADDNDNERGMGRLGALLMLLSLSGGLACAQWSFQRKPSEWAACIIAAGRVAGEWVRENPPLDFLQDAVEAAARLTALIEPCLESGE